MFTNRRLKNLLRKSKEIIINNSSRIVLISDCHRGDRKRGDDFAKNEESFLAALDFYYNNKYTLIEMGDGDELWEVKKFEKIYNAYPSVFQSLLRFHQDNKLFLLWGNHDNYWRFHENVRNELYQRIDPIDGTVTPLLNGVKYNESLVLILKDCNKKLFLIHGHQGDLWSYYLWPVMRLLVRYIWLNLQVIGIKDPTSPASNKLVRKRVERRLRRWIRKNDQPLIAGHTHRPRFPESLDEPQYYNTGSCIHPTCITCIEINNSAMTLVKWTKKGSKNKKPYRVALAGPRRIEDICK